jgi:hypothetical protein
MLDQRDDEKVRARLEIHLASALAEADDAVSDYEGAFAKPVRLRVLNISKAGDKHDYGVLGGAVVGALTRVERAERTYRAAKDPFQRTFGSAEPDASAAVLAAKPEGFDAVVRAAKAYRTALRSLKNRLKALRTTANPSSRERIAPR